MPKIHSDSRVSDNKGTAQFAQYCAFHSPQITWRPVSNDDIGIDGELELYNDQGEPLSEIIKVQLKSTEKDKGYIKNENLKSKTFTFYAEKDHVDYWQKLPNDVLLVIYDNRNGNNRLYAKKVENIDLKNIGTQNIPIQFHHEKDLIDVNENDFLIRFSRSNNPINPVIKPVSVGEEKLVSNLLQISFPTNKLYVASINYDRDEIIRNSATTEKRLKKNASSRDVARGALKQRGLNFSSDWTVFNNKLITFHDLTDSKNPLSQIIDRDIEVFSLEDFYEVNDDYKNVFKSLVRYCLQQFLFKLNYQWDAEDKIFRVIAPKSIPDNPEIVEGWVGENKARRTIFKSKFWEKGNLYYCTHFAFSIDIKQFGKEWFLCINPTWAVTVNGDKTSKVGYKKVSQLKKLERNSSVYNHLRFITYKLTYRDMFSIVYPFLEFHELASFKTDHIINEHVWLNTETAEEAKILLEQNTINESKDEN